MVVQPSGAGYPACVFCGICDGAPARARSGIEAVTIRNKLTGFLRSPITTLGQLIMNTYLVTTTHEDPEYRVIGVHADYLDDAIARLVHIPELTGQKVRTALAVPREDISRLPHVI